MHLFTILCITLYMSSCINVNKNNKNLINTVREILIENHPGFYDKLNPNFVKNEEICFVKAKNDPYEYVKCFNDGHLFLRKKIDKVSQKIQKQEILNKFDSKIEKDTIYLKIPTFVLSNDVAIQINKMVDIINQNSNKDIIIDIRNNGGGTNSYYQKILKAIFGESFYNKKMKKYYTDSYIDFRSTESNIKYLENRLGYDKNEFYSKTLDKCLQNKQDMCIIKLGHNIDLMNSLRPKNIFNKKIYVLIDKYNGSAALNFLDELMVLYGKNTILIGEKTAKDTLYMNLRMEESDGMIFGFPMQVMRNRLRGEGGYSPNINVENDTIDSCLKDISSFDECVKLERCEK